MGDSENSRTLPSVTRRCLHSTSVAWLTAQMADADLASGAKASGGSHDRVLSLWQQWMASHAEVERLCRKQQRLERRLIAAVGFPRVEVLEPGGEHPVAAFTAGEIDALLGAAEDAVEARRDAKAILRARQQAWRAMDERLGYSVAKQAEAAAEAQSEKLAQALWAAPAQSDAGIAAKLHAVLLSYEDDGRRDEPPWRQIRSILFDLTSLDRTTHNLSKT